MVAIEPQFNTHSPSLGLDIDSTARVPIKCINQPIPSPLGILDYCSLATHCLLSHVIINHDNAPLQVVSSPCFEDKIVNSNLDLIEYKEALVKQRKYLSRNETCFKYISQEHKDNQAGVINILVLNRKRDSLYSKSVTFQEHAVGCWSGTKQNDRLCSLPTMVEDETTRLGTSVVLFNMLDLCGLIEVDKLVDGRFKIRE